MGQGTHPWGFSGRYMRLPSQVPGPARLDLGTTRLLQQGARLSLPRRRGSWSKPREARAIRWCGSQGQRPGGGGGAHGSLRALSAHPSFRVLGAWVRPAQAQNLGRSHHRVKLR